MLQLIKPNTFAGNVWPALPDQSMILSQALKQRPTTRLVTGFATGLQVSPHVTDAEMLI